MIYENLPIEFENLPQLKEVKFTPLEKDYLWLRLSRLGLIFFLLLSAAILYGIFTSKFDWWLFPVIVSVIFILLTSIEIVGFRIKGFAIREHDISYRSGLIFYSLTSVPFNRIQHTEVSQNPIERLFDLAQVRVYTAGGSSSDISIPGLTQKDAHRLKDHLAKISSGNE